VQYTPEQMIGHCNYNAAYCSLKTTPGPA